ncbi:beta-galactosidase [Dyadobacter jejuensis]|uniref:Beta-galactosidase n=1 Tax=Dyadobacter jejuensis TaxID=1082580 RepID=A0A316AMD6_9BACT|nr:glycoside hydrolase family 2 TIM barrel-domain containing protein [Dyadobacter jejuensis]PWJ58702.1 beta-galactosidase [Dyadobacter jejuensis]
MNFKRLVDMWNGRKTMTLWFVFLSIQLFAQQHLNFDKNWKFLLGDVAGAESPDYADGAWRTLNVPHDWSIEGEYDQANPMGAQCGYLPAGFGWYRKTIPVPKSWKGKEVSIAFDGVFMNSTVWANGVKLGTRPYGWSSFRYDLSAIAQKAEYITFAVRVDNDKQPSARWYTGSGIYAHTWIDITDPIHIPRDGGVFVRTQGSREGFSAGSTVMVDTDVRNKGTQSKELIVRTTIVDPDGKVLSRTDNILNLVAQETQTVAQTMVLPTAQRWSLESPNLYMAVSEVYEGKTLKDRVETKFGIRDIEWKPESGMWLNGKNVKLQGVCNHQDAGALGAAVPDKILRFRIEQLKRMGVNAIRTTHNPQTPVFYDLCDELGMLVMDEVFDGWKKKAAEDYGARFFEQWWKRDLTDWIKRDRNHPSVVIYSVGNETGGAVGQDIVALCHSLDATRSVTSGHSGSEFMDVLGVNGHSEKMGFFDTMETDRVFIGTENTHTWQVRGYYRTKTWYRDGYPNDKQKPYEIPDLTQKEVFSHDWVRDEERGNRKQIFNSSYDNATVRLTARHNIAQIRDIPQYAGSFRWTGHDYIGEAGYVHGGWPFKSFMGGAIDMANFEKDLFYLYQSQWTNRPMLHILPHWTHPKVVEGTEIPVWVYSNCEEVELFLDGKSLGKKKPGAAWDQMQVQWLVPWHPGKIKAVGYKNGKAVSEDVRATALAPAKIALSVDGLPLAPSGADLVQVRVTTTDEADVPYPYGETRTYFHVFGPAKVKALDNGSPVDVEKHFEAVSRNAFYGLTRAYIESSEERGAVTLLASAILGEKKQITSNRVSIDTRLLSLRGKVPEMDINVFYTLDGSIPTPQANEYQGPFEVKLGTTVKALVMVDGKKLQYMEERFAEDEGFVWNDLQAIHRVEGEQAENAKFDGATIATNGKDFNGKAYLRFEKKKGAFIEWYQENDGGAFDADLYIRHSGKTSTGSLVRLTVNGKVVKEQLLLPSTNHWGGEWTKTKVLVHLGRGANTIRITTLDDTGVLIDEVLIK